MLPAVLYEAKTAQGRALSCPCHIAHKDGGLEELSRT